MSRLVPAGPPHAVAQAQPMPRAFNGDRLASDQDAREIRTSAAYAVSTPRTLAIKVPTWCALCALLLVSLGAIGRSGPARLVTTLKGARTKGFVHSQTPA
jgi:hypothetical protein